MPNTELTEANPDNVTSAETKLMDRLANIKLGEGNPLSTPNGAQTDSDNVTRTDGSNYKHHGDDEATCHRVKRIGEKGSCKSWESYMAQEIVG